MAKGPYKLKLTKLDWLSSVDSPAQGAGARALLIKRKGKRDDVSIVARVTKLDDSLGLVFGHAFAASLDGGATEHIDFQDDAIDPDFLKAAMDFVAGGGATDVNHDGNQDGRIVFAWPLIPEVNEALGIKSDVVGLAVAVKPSAETYKRFQSGELTGFSLAGSGERTPLGKRVGKSRLRKEAVLTSLVDGHQHTVSLDDPSTSWCDSYSTSYQTAEGAENGHSHAWIFDPASGAITIAADSGHTHTVKDVVPPDVLAAYAALDAAEDARNAEIAAAPIAVTDDPSDGIPMVMPVEESSGKVINVVIAARDPRSKSTPKKSAPTVKPQPENTMPTPEETKIVDLTKRVERAERLATFSDVQKAHLDSLKDATEREAFFAKSSAERDVVVMAAASADVEVYKCDDGTSIRKSHGELAARFAKQSDEATRLAKASAARTEVVELEKRADKDLSHFAKTVNVRAAIIKAIDGIADEAVRKEAHESLKGANAACLEITKARGTNPGSDASDVDPLQAWETGLAGFAKTAKIENPLDAIGAFLGTDEGRALKKSYDATRAFNQPGSR